MPQPDLPGPPLPEPFDLPGALVVGAGPAGLAAAEVLSGAGRPVLVADAMPSPARKFLMAGKSGLNLTKDEARGAFHAAYGPDLPPALRAALDAFGPEEVMGWARGLGQEVFAGSTGRVFPVAWKASPLLRAWLARLEAQGATLRTRWRWTGWEDDALRFATPEGPRLLRARATVLALGGASWRRLGSDGAWAALFPGQVAPFAPSNMGLLVRWSPHMARHFGEPVKGAAWSAGPLASRGEVVVSGRGLEGGGLYPLSRPLREGAPLTLDLFPDLAEETLRGRLGQRGRESLANHLRKRLGLDGARAALLQEWGRPLPPDLAPLLKRLPVRHDGPRPLDEAISTAGGLRFGALTDGLMLHDRPGTFAAGEMLDWEAPTGGYLLTACMALGRRAGQGASAWLAR
ncbi:NAD(FAD)-utilizing dehydrogenase [Rubellimicrobium mesophilum DSM 19309]|uniref:NAD(FAD)-utilizing dehydrogenase n=1 Tax=Rubellimicrobium mesophilum DSM 19309 TaxID=442562 RepID=A0A017HLN1_9RHOB|nr:TIGR03862 family flavoprotein [Rubellimicrobium mesophilum]EYD74684.1 NAD(FAD)-utilizing dehydrogenase [Rubellimicrobium mesophilum DSM 19309]